VPRTGSDTGGGGSLAGDGWKQVGTADAFVFGVDPQDPETLYGAVAALPSSRLGKSRDGGVSWTSLPYPGLYGPDLVTVDPRNPRVVYAGGMERTGTDSDCKVLRSTTGGHTWRCMTGAFEMDGLVIDPARPATVYLLAGIVFKSQDHGATWTSAGRGLPQGLFATSLALDPTNPRQLYLGVGGETAVYRSIDGARTWSPSGSGVPSPITSLVVDPRTPSTLYAGVRQVGAFVSTDRGATWGTLSGGLPAALFTGEILLDPLPPTMLYAVTTAGVYALDLRRGPL